MPSCRKMTIVLLLSELFLLSGEAAFGISATEVNSGIVFNFSPPGARSLALGGAFIGLADDATAAYVNPAGLTLLSRPQLSMEVRGTSFTHSFSGSGRFNGTPTDMGIDSIDNISGVQETNPTDDVLGLTFFSLVYPGKRWSVGFYRHELTDFKAEYESRGVLITLPLDDRDFPGQDHRIGPSRGKIGLDVTNVGVSAAYEFGNLSLGIGLSYYSFLLATTSRKFSGNSGVVSDEPGTLYGPADFSEETNLTWIASEDGDDADWGVNLGFLWNMNQDLTIGGNYRQGPDFEMKRIFRPGPKAGPDLLDRGVQDDETRFHVPDLYGLGVAYHRSPRARITFDYVRVEYSQLVRDLISIDRVSGPELAFFVVDDSDELHLGFEYFLLNARVPISIRLGAWHEPDHKIRYTGEKPRNVALWRPGKEEMHYAVGFGVTTRTLQLDAAFDYSDRDKTASVSAVYRF